MHQLDGNKLRSLPNAEVHVHIEGSSDADRLALWAAEDSMPLPRPKERLFEFRALGDFLQFLDWACGLANSHDRVAQLAYDFCRRLDRDGTGYADVIINPTHWKSWRGRPQDLINALDSGFWATENDRLSPVGLCVSLLHTQSANEAAELVDMLIDWCHPRVVALSIDGNETAAGRTGPRFAEALAKAGRAGLKRTVHAGETSGAEGVRDAIELLAADRIDHGVRAIEDERVVALLVEKQIPPDICPSSNIDLGVFPSLAERPVNRLRAAGVRFR